LSFQLTAEPNPGFTFEGWSTYDSAEIFGLGSEWHYIDNGSDLGTTWRDLNFDDSSWSVGTGEFGYGDGDEATTVSYGPDAGNKYITTYFRKTFEYTGDDSYPVSCILNVRRDDGVVVYHNGTEIARSNMPGGDVNYLTTAIEAIGGDGETALTEFLVELPLVTGNNVIAVEIHQQSGTSSDISFDASLSMLTPSDVIISTDTTINLYLGGDAGYIARYIPTGECLLPPVISENMTLTIDCSPYLASGDTYIEPGVSVTVNPGVQVWFPENARLVVQGDLQVNGTEDMPVLFKANSAYGAESWGNISFENCTDVNHLTYLEVRDATEGYHPIHNRAAISGWFSEIVLDHVTLTENFSNPIFGEYSSFTLTNSLIHSAVTGDLINVKYGDGYISDCVFIGNNQPDTDAIDYDEVIDGVVRNSRIEGFYGFNSDGLDLGEECVNILVENCLINDCTDKGISIGQSSSAVVKNTTIVDCNLGFGIKDLGVAEVDHLTLYSNVIGMECYEKNPGLGGGYATVTNSIFSNSSQTPVYLDDLSEFSASQCIYDTDTMPGETNWYLDPEFVSPTFYDFHLESTSGAIAAGTDGLDLGTLDHTFTSDVKIMVSEIMYDNLGNPDKEYIKLLNAGSVTVDLSGYVLEEAFDFVFPEGTQISPDEEITIARDITLFPDMTGQMYQWTAGQLNNAGEMIILKEQHGIIIDHVLYDNALPWLTLNDTDQYLSLVSPMLDNHFASSWELLPEPVMVNESQITSIALFPNPASSQISIISDEPISHIEIRDASGRVLLSGSHSGMNVTLDVDHFPAGVYFASINHTHRLRFVVKP
ncbi:MAG: Inner spore coat protein, partial [Bacteroidota bacterium]